MRYQAARGTHDVLPADAHRWQSLEREFAATAELYGYREIRTPAFEDTELFVRSSGEGSEVVSKQMYTFLDKGDRSLTLKPEGTAPVLRALIEAGQLAQHSTTRVWYATPIYRYERPSKGRYREAHQVGFELLGSHSPDADAEVVELTVRFFERLGLQGLRVLINSIGGPETRAAYSSKLLAHVGSWLEAQPEEVRAKALANPMRLLDTKDPELRQVLEGAPMVLDSLESASVERFEQVRRRLSEAGVEFEVKPDIVRGLDYYTETVFEVVATSGLGSQDSLCGGGRYAGLAKELGGADVPGVGVAIGVERVLLVMEALGISPPEPRLGAFLVAATPAARQPLFELARTLREKGVSCTLDLDGRSMKAQLRQADRERARFAVIVGDDELASGQASVRDLDSSQQKSVPFEEVACALR